jgi:hypothetical protein
VQGGLFRAGDSQVGFIWMAHCHLFNYGPAPEAIFLSAAVICILRESEESAKIPLQLLFRGLVCIMKTKLQIIYGTVLTLAATSAALAVEPTAYNLVREGDKFVGEQSKDKVVQIRSERSVGTLVPDIWYVVYYDPDAPLKAVEVKFGAGQKMDVSRPLRLLEPITGADKVLSSTQLKVDSDRALEIARSQPLLQNLTVTSTQFWLQHADEGPRWKIKLWAAKINHPSRQVDVGDVYISTADASVVRADLHPEHVQ